MLTVQNLNKLIEVSYTLSKKYQVAHHIVVIDPNLKFQEIYGKCDYKKHIIYIADDIDLYKAVKIVHHEFRHAWQAKYYPDIFKWWLAHKTEYYCYYKQYLNVLELDARIFGRTFGDRDAEFLLNFYSVAQLDMFARRNCLDLAQSVLMLAAQNSWIDPFVWKKRVGRIIRRYKLR